MLPMLARVYNIILGAVHWQAFSLVICEGTQIDKLLL